MRRQIPQHPASAVAGEALLRLSDTGKSFGSTSVLRAIEVAVPHHQVAAPIRSIGSGGSGGLGGLGGLGGSGGSGGSSHWRSINLLKTIDDGRIFLRGSDICDPGTRVDAVRARIGVVWNQCDLSTPHGAR